MRLVLFVALLLPEVALTQPDITVLTVNLAQGGTSSRDVVALATRQKADVLVLQETVVTAAGHQPRDIAKALGMEWHFAKNFDHRGGKLGLAVLSRHPVKARRTLKVPGSRKRIVAMRLDVGGKVIYVLGIHLPSVPKFGRWQSEHKSRAHNRSRGVTRITSYLASHPRRKVIIAGDFNVGPSTALYRRMAEHAQDLCKDVGPTWPASKPFLRLDYVWLRGDFGRGHRCAATELAGSDHLGVVATIRL